MQLVFGDLEENYKKAKTYIEDSAKRKTEIILLPELWSSGYDLKNSTSIARQNKVILQKLTALAIQSNLTIGGSLLEEENGDIYNTFSLISNEGQIVAPG